MAINPEDVKLFESQRLTDEDDGGGRATGQVVLDGEINNLFPDISRIDRTIGDVALRKAFIGIATDNADTYLGAHAILTKKPVDGNVHTLLFTTNSESDERTDARNRIESYVVKGAEGKWQLLGEQLAGQRQLVAVQRLEAELPAVGDVFCLVFEEKEQYVRLTEVESSVETFTYYQNNAYVDFERRRLVLGISSPLLENFPGGQPTPSGTTTPRTTVLTTEVADASKYYGITELAEAAQVGDVRFKVNSIYTSLVPSAQAEQPLVDLSAAGLQSVIEPAASVDLSIAWNLHTISTTPRLYRGFLPRAAVPGSVQLTLSSTVYTDDGAGTLTRSSGALGIPQLSINYETGEITGEEGSASGTLTGTAVFRPGVSRTGRVTSIKRAVTIANRGYNWTFNLAEAKPKPGSLRISFMALGKWYDITDQGNGQLTGAGTGSISYQTGSAAVTLQALPDADTDILVQWVADLANEFQTHNGAAQVGLPEFTLQLDPGVKPGSVSATYTAGGQTKTITDNFGQLQGDGSGSIDYAAGTLRMQPSQLPDDATSIDVDYERDTPSTDTQTPVPDGVGVITGTIPGAPLLPGSVTLAFDVGRQSYNRQNNTTEETLQRVTVRDDGSGGFIGYTGSINYTTGDYTLTALRQYQTTVYSGQRSVDVLGNPVVEYQSNTSTERETLESAVQISYQASGAVHAAQSGSFTPTELAIDLIADTTNPLLAGSVLFDWAGNTYIDRDGILYANPSDNTGAATAVGEVNYTARRVTLTTWPAGAGQSVSIQAAATVAAAVQISTLTFRTPSSPLRPTSLQITATRADTGGVITAQEDGSGNLNAAVLSGSVNVETGVVDLWFTTDDQDTSGNSDVPVWPNTIRYNAVLYSFLPLDAQLIGLDPVRLPSDGRVPIFREGDVVVLAHTAETNANTPTDGQTITLARDHQAAIEIVDSLGAALDPAQYTANKLAGTVTFANPLTLQDAEANALTPPLTIRDRVEHMSVVNDVQINGDLSIIAPISQDFPAAETVVSSALVFGDINARVFSFFTQKTWNSGSPNWTDDRIGDDTTANYNTVDFPIEVVNRGAISEKWALVFTSSTAFQIVGQTLGIIGTGAINADCSPINPNTTAPYFVARSGGWGSGWVAGNVVRFNTDGCLAPIWISRTVLAGQGEEEDDSFTVQLRGDAD